MAIKFRVFYEIILGQDGVDSPAAQSESLMSLYSVKLQYLIKPC